MPLFRVHEIGVFMFRKNLFIVMLLLTLVGCKDDSNNSNQSPGLPGPTEQVGQGSGWPSAKLPDYSLAGWAQPTGLSGISWAERQAGGQDYYFLDIAFTSATVATKDSINNYLETWASASPNWIQDDQNSFEVIPNNNRIVR